MQAERANTWTRLQELLYEGAFQPGLGRFRSTFAFRGMSDAARGPTPSLRRIGTHYPTMERHILRNFRKYAFGVSPSESVWFWLSVGQHHGLPTRLLDWSFSPEIALHFVTVDEAAWTCDGAVLCVDYRRVHRHAPPPLRDALEREASDVFTIEMLAALAPDLDALASLEAAPFPLFFEPPSLDQRIVNQYALHSVMSTVDAELEAWLDTHPECMRRILVPAELKGEVRDKLDQANVTERVLFPGLDGLSAWLRRQYAARPEASALRREIRFRRRRRGEAH